MSIVTVTTPSGVIVSAVPHIMLMRLCSLYATLEKSGRDFNTWTQQPTNDYILMQFEEVVAQTQVMLQTRWDRQLGQQEAQTATTMIIWLLRIPTKFFHQRVPAPQDPFFLRIYEALRRVDWERLRVEAHVMKYGVKPII